MLFGQSVFQSVLTRLKEERTEEDAEETGVSIRIKGLGLGFVAATEEVADIGTGTEAYFAWLSDADDDPNERPSVSERPISAPEPKPPTSPAEIRAAAQIPVQIPAHLLRLNQAEIAAELAITDKDTETTLAEKRRRFAKANHPDGVPEAFRENAGIRMKTANLLIDTAMKNLFWR